MPAQMKHGGGLVDAILELGFDNVKYFEITATGAAQTLSISPPAKRLTLRNSHASADVYFNITGTAATTSVSAIPGDDIKLGPSFVFTMDFDNLTTISFITGGTSVLVEGILGWKGTAT